jgi:hypothetical protein
VHWPESTPIRRGLSLAPDDGVTVIMNKIARMPGVEMQRDAVSL